MSADNYTAVWSSTKEKRNKLCPFDLVKYLVSKRVISKIEINKEVLFQAILACERQMETNQNLNMQKVKNFTILMRSFVISDLDDHQVRELKRLNSFIPSLLLNPRSKGSLKWREYEKVSNSSVYYRTHRSNCPSLKELTRIAVGYKDKGNARNIALDASPNWQEVFPILRETSQVSQRKKPKLVRDYLANKPTLNSQRKSGLRRKRKEQSLLY